MTAALAWFQFLVCVALIGVAGTALSRYGDGIAVSVVSAVMMSGIVIVGLLYRPKTRLFRTVGWASLLLLLIYLLNAFALYLHGR